MQNKRLKNTLVFWFSCMVALAILISGLFFLGKPVTKKSLVGALPVPDEGSFYILYVDESPTLLQMRNFVSLNKVLLAFPFFDRFDFRFISMFLTILEDSKTLLSLHFLWKESSIWRSNPKKIRFYQLPQAICLQIGRSPFLI